MSKAKAKKHGGVGNGRLIIAPARQNPSLVQRMKRGIAKAIKDTGLSDVELNRQAGISIAMARRLVVGEVSDMKLSTLARLIKFAGVDPAEIIKSIS